MRRFKHRKRALSCNRASAPVGIGYENPKRTLPKPRLNEDWITISRRRLVYCEI